MSKILNRLNKPPLTGVPGAPAFGPGTYEPSILHIAFGFAATAKTVITIAVSVILPAQMHPGSRNAQMLAASMATAAMSVGLDTATSIDVVAARQFGSSTVRLRIEEGASQTGPLGKTSSPALVRASGIGH